MLFNDRRKGLSLSNQANDSMIKRNQDKNMDPLDYEIHQKNFVKTFQR